jgi:hypothetical protein
MLQLCICIIDEISSVLQIHQAQKSLAAYFSAIFIK